METDPPGSSIDLIEEIAFLSNENDNRNTSDDSDDSDDSDIDRDEDPNSQKKEIQNDPHLDEKLSEYSTFHGYKVLKRYAGEKIEVGLRVVRPQSWKPKSDYKFGHGREIGTIVDITESGEVKVQWDSGGNDNFEKGSNDQFDLLLFDNAQTDMFKYDTIEQEVKVTTTQYSVKHTKIHCHGCGVHPLRGMRWKCKICRDYDLCTDCYMSNVHDHTHKFKRMLSTDSKGEQMPPRENQEFTRALGIKPNAYVHLHSDPKHKGRVVKYIEHDIETYRSDAIVKWNDNVKGRYRVGRNGQCDLKYLDAAKGPMYYEDHLPIAIFENVQKGARVVRGPGWDDNNDQDGGNGFVGTVTHVGDFKAKENIIPVQEKAVKSRHMLTHKHDVLVQWDNGNIEEYSLSSTSLLLFDNGPLGVEHKGYVCECCPNDGKNYKKKYIRGIRWKCITCHDFDLCNICYMSDKHDLGHKFQRCVAANLREDMQTSREHPRHTARQSYGIFKDAKVVKVAQVKEDEKEGIVMDIDGCKVDTGRNEVQVKWIKYETPSSHRILDLKYDKGGAFYYYNDHLPALGRNSRGYFAVKFVSDCKAEKTISVNIWRTIQQVKKLTFKPSLYLIFANHTDVDEKGEKNDKMILMEEVLDFAKKTKLPCHVVGQKVLFHSGSTNAVFIHYKTEKDTIKGLVKKGFRTFDRGDTDVNDEDEIHYFIRMAEYIKGEAVLPVLISFRNGGMTKEVLKSAAISKIPIIRLQKHCLDVTVLTTDQEYACGKIVQMTEHHTDLKHPWSIKTSKQRDHKLRKCDGKDDLDEIALISQIQGNFCDNLDTLVCCLIIGVSMKEDSLEKSIFGVYTQEYPNALSMYLLKEGKWKIPKEFIKASFSHRSIEYIYEEDMTSEIKKGLWSHLKSMTNMAYEAPNFQHVREKEQDDTEGDIRSSTDSSSSDDENKIRTKIAKRIFKKAKQKKKRRKIELDVSTSELYGLILYALLKKQYWNGAQQLIETGCIRIRQILIGCVLLEDEIKNWRTSPHLKEKLQRFKSAITQRAIRITSCICVADKKSKEKSMTIKDKKFHDHDDDSEHKVEKELGEHINHAGRLLVNHGYIEDAIKTQNKTFLDNPTVKNILNEMWYGTEKLNFRTSVCFFGLAVVHIIVLPLLMISMEEGPLIWFYKKYKLPFMKVLMHMLGFLTLNTAYAYMLLFDYSNDGLTYSDYFILVWMVSFLVDESKQQIVSIIRKQWKKYAKDLWNILDWLSMTVYAFGMMLKLGQESQFRNASKVLLVTAFILLSIRILNLFCMSAMLGPKLVMIRKMARDTVSFMMILVVIMMCYNISFYALLYPNSEFSWLQIEKIIQNGYWMLFGELNLDSDTLSEPHCTFNKAVYENTDIQRCPEMLGVYIAPYLKALYGLIAVILLLNLLIAMYSDTFQKVHQESEFYWAQIQTDFLEEYSIKTVFPVHLQLLVLPAAIIHAILWYSSHRYKKWRSLYSRNKNKSNLNHRPMFVRVFLYNTNFDLKLKTTKEAEGNGALHAKGDIDLTEFDRITMLQRQMDNNSKKRDKQNEKIIGSLHHMNKKLSKIAKSVHKIEEHTEDEDDHHHFTFSSDDDSDSQSVSSEEYTGHTRRRNHHWL